MLAYVSLSLQKIRTVLIAIGLKKQPFRTKLAIRKWGDIRMVNYLYIPLPIMVARSRYEPTHTGIVQEQLILKGLGPYEEGKNNWGLILLAVQGIGPQIGVRSISYIIQLP